MEKLRNLEITRKYSAFNDSTGWCAKVLQEAGFSDVHRIAHEADGKMTKEEALMYKKAAEHLYLGRMDSFNRFYPGLITPKVPKHWADEYYTTLPTENCPLPRKRPQRSTIAPHLWVCLSLLKNPVYEPLSWPGIPEIIWALLSPERSVLEAIRLQDGAFSITTSDEKIEYYLSYFDYLIKYDYLEKYKQQQIAPCRLAGGKNYVIS